jgi:hypothetical protein
MDCRVKPGNDEIKIRSRGAIFVGAAGLRNLCPSNLTSRSIEETLASSFRSLEREKGSGTPVDADPYPPHLTMRLCPPLRKQLACRRSTRGSHQRDFRPKGSASGHASWDAAGAYDPLIALPGEERTFPRPRAPHSLRFREYPRPKASFTERDSHRDITEPGTHVNGNVTTTNPSWPGLSRPSTA